MIKINKLCKNEISKEIGSNYDLSQEIFDEYINHQEQLEWCDDDTIFLSSCRMAINLILKNLRTVKGSILLPAFTCSELIALFQNRDYQVFSYPVSADFTVDINLFQKAVSEVKPSIIFIHDFFGFDTNKELRECCYLNKLKDQGIIIIDDCTQTMFSNIPRITANYCVGSIRKWLGIIDGALLKGKVSCANLAENTEYIKEKCLAMLYKHRFLSFDEGQKIEMLKMFRKAAAILDSQEDDLYRISNMSLILLKKIFNVDEFNKRRIQNFNILATRLNNIEWLNLPFKHLDEGIVPFYFPILISDHRKDFQQYLAENNVYATVLWRYLNKFSNTIDNESRRIYENLLCIPCDYRYGINDMNYICDLIDSCKN